MKIHTVLNNNAVIILNDKGIEEVVMGRGIAFGKSKGDILPKSDKYQFYKLESKSSINQMRELINEIPIEYFELVHTIVSAVDLDMNDIIYLTLSDHIYLAVTRFRDGVSINNPLLWEIRHYHKDDYQAALLAMDIIEEELNVRLPDDEAGNIAFHFINARQNQENTATKAEIEIVANIDAIVRNFYGIKFEEEDIYYYRFITHLRLFAKRLLSKSFFKEDDGEDLLGMVKTKFSSAYVGVQRIETYVKHHYQYELTQEEKAYLAMHIHRLLTKAERVKQ